MSFLLSFSWDLCCGTFLINASVSLFPSLSLVYNGIVIGEQYSKLWQQNLFFLGGKVIRPYCFSLPAPARISLLQSWTKVLGTILQYSYFLLFLGSLLKQCSVFEIFFQFSLPPPYTQLKLGKKIWIHASNIVCGVRGGVGPVGIGKRCRNATVPQDVCP